MKKCRSFKKNTSFSCDFLKELDVIDQKKQEKILPSSVAEERKAIKCPVCNDSFSTIDEMKIHIGSTHFQLW